MELERILITEEEIRARVRELGQEISRDYAGKSLLVIGVLKGAFVFMADLIREIKVPLEVDFMTLASYGPSTSTSGEVRLMRDLNRDITGREVLVVEDIVDTGLTLHKMKELLALKKPAAVKIAVFLDKPSRRRTELIPDYCGRVIEDHFVVGYGLDYKEEGRQYPFIGIVKEKR